jgi:acetamidase/formamidase
MTAPTATDHELGHDDATHRAWDNSLTPALTVDDGAVVEFDCRQASGDAIHPETTDEESATAPFPGHLLTGPIAIDGATSGDVLAVEILAVETGDWGHTVVHPDSSDRGLLAEAFRTPAIYHWEIEDDVARFRHRDDVAVPLAPFPGTVGLAPAADGEHHTIPPRSVGGNLDVTALTAGSTLFLPVAVDGGLLSIGDGHAAQGDGEVCVTALEASIDVTVRLSVRADVDTDGPAYATPPGPAPGSRYGTTGIAEACRPAAREAIRRMVDHLADHGLTREEAYVVCSVAADLSMNELVNERVVVSAEIPTSVIP